jgi:hypothetical protein
MTLNWAAIAGIFEFAEHQVIFKGRPIVYKDANGVDQPGYTHGLSMSSPRFAGGEISADIRFEKIAPLNSCELIFWFDPERNVFLSAALGAGPAAFAIRFLDTRGGAPVTYAIAGDRGNLVPNHSYHLAVSVQGSRVRLSVDSVEVAAAVLPGPIPPSQAGLYCFDDATVTVANFRVNSQLGKAFVVMQLSAPFNEIYEDVVKRVCAEEPFQIEAVNAMETYGPGLIMADVVRDIVESEFVIAEITPANPNVYYELGFADAVGKPVIMLADREELPKLPFDVSSSRVLFYENSIAGKRLFEEGLRRHIRAILEKNTRQAGTRPNMPLQLSIPPQGHRV